MKKVTEKTRFVASVERKILTEKREGNFVLKTRFSAVIKTMKKFFEKNERKLYWLKISFGGRGEVIQRVVGLFMLVWLFEIECH